MDISNAKSNQKAIFAGKTYRITILSEALIRFEYSATGIFEDRPTQLAIFRNFSVPEFSVKEDPHYLDITSKYFHLEYHKEADFAGPKYAPDKNLKVSLVDTDKVWYYNHPEARNFSGTYISLDNNSGKPPYKKGLYSTDGFASIDDGASMFIDENENLLKNEKKRIDIYLFIYRRDFGVCLRDYFKLTGRPPLIPRYALGIWWNKNEAYSAEDLKNLVKKFNKEHIPVSILLLGEDWHIRYETSAKVKLKTGFTFNDKLYPDAADFITYMNERGVRVGLQINPTEGIMPYEKNFADFSSGFNIPSGTIVPFNVFDNNFMSAYFRAFINPLSNIGVDFFWLDYDKDIATLGAFNYYHIREYEKNIKRREFILARNSLIAAHRYGVHYSGETIVDWKTLELLPSYNSTAANIGISWWSHSISGFKEGIEDRELYARYVQLGTFSPIFRFASASGKYYKREPWLWDVKTYSIVKDYCNFRHQLIPYLYTENYKYHKTGLPLIQPLYYQKPEIYDEPYYKNQYYFGTELFVSPVTTKKDEVMNRALQRIYLPEGIWYEFKSGKKYVGNKRYVSFIKDEDYPVFARSGAIIPLAALEENINVTNPPKTLELHIFPGISNTYNLYEDDGYTDLYKEGYYINTQIDYNYLASNYTVIIRPTEGKGGIIPAQRDYKIRFRNVKVADEVTAFLGGDSLPITSYEDGSDFVVEVRDVDTLKQLTINCKGKDIEIDAVRIINEDIDSIISDLQIETSLKVEIAKIIFSEIPIQNKRVEIRKLRRKGLKNIFIRMFIKLLEYIAEV